MVAAMRGGAWLRCDKGVWGKREKGSPAAIFLRGLALPSSPQTTALNSLPAASQGLVEVDYGLHLLKVVLHLRDAGVEQARLGLDDFKVAGALGAVELTGVFYVLREYLDLLGLQLALLVRDAIEQQGV